MSGNVDQSVFRQILIRNIILPLVIGVVSSAMFVGLIFYTMDLNSWVYKTNVILLKLNKIEKSYLESIGSLRGFLLTQNPSYLEAYNATAANYEKDLDDLARNVSDNPSQVQKAQELKQNFTNWIQFGNQVLDINKVSGVKAATEFRARLTGGRVRGAVTNNIEQFREVEENLRDQRVQKQNEFVRLSVAISIALSLIFGVLIAFFGRRQLLSLSSSYEDILKQQVEQNNILSAQNWIKTGQTELNLQMSGDLPLLKLSENIIRYISSYINAKVAAIYVANEHYSFDLKGTFAYPLKNTGLESFKLGETLLGEAAKDGKIFETKNVPSEYFKVSSGLGEMKPRNLLIVPVTNNNQTTAVMEFGFTEDIDPTAIDWLKQIQENVAVAIKTAKYKEHLELLLEEVQNQAEELQSQQEELRVSNEELEEQAKVLKEAQARLESQQAELEQTNTQLEAQAQALESQAEDLKEKNLSLENAKQDLAQKAEELKKSSQYKSEFLANMSHELRTPLNSSLILAKLLADNKGNNLTSEQVEYAKQIQSSGNDLLMLINDILDLSKVEAGKIDVVLDDVIIQDFTRQLENTFRPIALEKKVDFKVDIDKSVPAKIVTDSLRLEQIIKNLLSNAFKFTQKGSVTLRITRSHGDMIDFSVIDTGIGIDPDKQQIIFEAFRQADGTTNRKFGGTGLGLSISRNLAHLLGGEILVQSEQGQGSTFTLSVPEKFVETQKKDLIKTEIPPAPVKLKTFSENTSKPLRKPFVPDDRENLNDSHTVLIIEDDPAFAKILCNLAREQNFKCIITDHASEALELAKIYKPRAILLDIRLPDLNGMVVLDHLKRNVSTRHIPVHVISAVDFIKDALEMGAVGYALKPAEADELKKVFSVLQQKISETVQKVLIIEDDKVQREAIKHLIRTDKIQTMAVGTGKEALNILNEENFNCVVVDLNLPDMTGFDLLDKISKLKNQKNLPVIVYTGRDLTSDEENRLRRHSESVIVKGARSPERLLSEVTLFLHQVESKLDPQRQKMLEELRSREKIFDKKSILIVDDDMRNVFALTAVIEGKGANAIIAKNGQEALDKLEKESVDIVLMDIMMPVMDGYKAMEAIRKQKKFDRLPIIALTAKAMKDDRELCLKAGANDYLAKPIDVEKLLSLMRIWISQGGRK